MAKRFIDTEIFADGWFMDLSMSGKILWIYLITNCDHAGIIKWNKKMIIFQTGIESLETVAEELGNRLVSLRKEYVWIPKFIEFQYPGFPNSKVRQQNSAVLILLEFGIRTYKNLTLSKDLPKSYGNGNVNGNVKKGGMGGRKEKMNLPENYGKVSPSSITYSEYKKMNSEKA